VISNRSCRLIIFHDKFSTGREKIIRRATLESAHGPAKIDPSDGIACAFDAQSFMTMRGRHPPGFCFAPRADQ
jgi:hypothetical protein